MFAYDLLFALIVALVLTVLFVGVLRRPGRGEGWLWFFAIVLLASWAGGVWARPVGPAVWGYFWVPFVFVGLSVAVLLAASAPRERPRTRREALEQHEAEEEAESALTALAWAAAFLFLAAIAANYIMA